MNHKVEHKIDFSIEELSLIKMCLNAVQTDNKDLEEKLNKLNNKVNNLINN